MGDGHRGHTEAGRVGGASQQKEARGARVQLRDTRWECWVAPSTCTEPAGEAEGQVSRWAM